MSLVLATSTFEHRLNFLLSGELSVRTTRRSGINVTNTRYSQAVSHPSTNHARPGLTSVIERELVLSWRSSVIERELVLSWRYGRWHDRYGEWLKCYTTLKITSFCTSVLLYIFCTCDQPLLSLWRVVPVLPYPKDHQSTLASCPLAATLASCPLAATFRKKVEVALASLSAQITR